MTATEAWKFFSSPHHLNEITPNFFNIEITSNVPNNIYAGLMISYKMKAVFGIPMAWLSEISHCQEPRRFVYEQRIGPFKFWSHEVCITEASASIFIEDIVFYAMPFGWIGQILNNLLIGKKLSQIFDTRHDYLESQWSINR